MAYSADGDKNMNSLTDEMGLCCSVCFEEYQYSGIARIPKLLPCNHTFCYTCLSSLKELDGCLRCALCRKEHQILNLEYLPNDASIINFLKNKDVQLTAEKRNRGAVPKNASSFQTASAVPSMPQRSCNSSRRFSKRIYIQTEKCGAVIGKGGWSINLIKSYTGVNCYLNRHLSNPWRSLFVIEGDDCDGIADAVHMMHVRAGLRRESDRNIEFDYSDIKDSNPHVDYVNDSVNQTSENSDLSDQLGTENAAIRDLCKILKGSILDQFLPLLLTDEHSDYSF